MSDWLVYLLALCSLLLMVTCWQHLQMIRKNGRSGWLRLSLLMSSLLLMMVAYLIWQAESGAEFSVLFVLFHGSWLAWLLIASQAKIRYREQRIKHVNKVSAEYPWRYKLLVVLLVMTVGLLAAVCLSLWMSRALVNELANQWVLAFILVPLIWGVLATWFSADRRLIRPTVFTLLVLPLSFWLL